MRRNWIIGGAIVVLLAALLLGGQFWSSHRSPSSGAGASLPGGISSQLGQQPVPAQGTSKSGSAGTSAKPVPPSKAAEPPAPGKALVKLPSAPAKTIGGFDVGYLPVNGRYIVTVQPFGFGPMSGSQPTLVVKIASVTPLPGVTGSQKLLGVTTVARISPASATAYSKGGTYTALLSFAADSQGLVAQLSPPMSAQTAKQAIAAAKAQALKKK